MALSIISSGVTQTGQPGPCTNSISRRQSSSMPYLTMVCVCPPQTSMIVQGRVVTSRDGLPQLPCGRTGRDIRPGISWRFLQLQIAQLVHPLQEREDCCASSSSITDRAKPTCTITYWPRSDLGHVLQAHALGDAAEIHLAHQHVVLAIGLDHLSGNAQAHRVAPHRVRPGKEKAEEPAQGQRDSRPPADGEKPAPGTLPSNWIARCPTTISLLEAPGREWRRLVAGCLTRFYARVQGAAKKIRSVVKPGHESRPNSSINPGCRETRAAEIGPARRPRDASLRVIIAPDKRGFQKCQGGWTAHRKRANRAAKYQ